MKINTSTAFVDLLAESVFSVVAKASLTPSQLLRRIGVTIRRFGVYLFAMSFFFSPLSLEAGQKKSGKSKKSGTSLVNKKSSASKSKSAKKKKSSASKSKGAKKKKNSESKSPSNAPASNPSPSSPSTPPELKPSVELLLTDILINLETYKPELAVSNDAYSELQLLLREFGPEDIVETLKSGDQTAPFFTALKTKNVLTSSDLISELKNILSSQNMTMEDLVYWASPLLDPPPAGLLNVRGGVFELGSQIGGQVAVFTGQRVSRFQIAVYETTWSEWKAVRDWANNNGYDIGSIGSGQGEDYPAMYVNWYDVLKWCNAKSESEGQTPVYTFGSITYKSGQVIPSVNPSANGYRLPTEMEWEWAARGGLFSNGYVYSGSNSIDSIAWYYYNSGTAGSPQTFTKPIGTKLPNELGIYDMSGNVSELCFDTFAFFDSTRAWARGGSSSTYDVGCTVIVRGHYALGDRQPSLGFRVARNASVYTTPPTPTPIPTPTPQPQGTVTTLAGSGTAGSADGTGVNASFNYPSGVAVDQSGNVYVADAGNNRIRKITSNGTVTTLAGSGTAGSADGTGVNASFNYPSGVAVDQSGNVYVADAGNNRIRKITSNGTVTTLAGSGTSGSVDGIGVNASFSIPCQISIDKNGYIYVADNCTRKIRTISPLGVVSTLIEIGGAFPSGVAVDSTGNVYFADQNYNKIYYFTINGAVGTLAGGNGGGWLGAGSADGIANSASFYSPQQVAVDGSGNIYVADSGNSKIRKIQNGVVTTFAGSGIGGSANGPSYSATFYGPKGIAVDGAGNIYVADAANHKIRKITQTETPTPTPQYQVTVTTLAGSGSAGSADGQGKAASFNWPNGIAVDGSGNVYVADSSNYRIRKVTQTGSVTTLSGANWVSYATGQSGATYILSPQGVAIDGSGNIYVSEFSAHRIRKITPSGMVTTLAGSGTAGSADGQGTAASFNWPTAIALDGSGNVYVADNSNRIRKITPSGNVTTLAGTFKCPEGVAVDGSGNVYVADVLDHRIWKITPSGMVTILAGSGSAGIADGQGTAASFWSPYGVAVDGSGNVYVADSGNFRIRKITPSGMVTTLAGSGTAGSADGQGTAASFYGAHGVAVDGSGNVYVLDSYNQLIRKITISQ